MLKDTLLSMLRYFSLYDEFFEESDLFRGGGSFIWFASKKKIVFVSGQFSLTIRLRGDRFYSYL